MSNILFDLRTLSGEWSGIATYTFNLLNALLGDTGGGVFFLFSNEENREAIEKRLNKSISSSKIIYFDVGIYSLTNFYGFNRLIREKKVSLYFTPQFFWPVGFIRVPVVNIIHDIIPLTHSQYLFRSRKTRWKFLFEVYTKLSLRYSARTLVNSMTTLESLESYFGKSLTKNCRVCYPVLDQPVLGSDEKLDKVYPLLSSVSYFLYVGRQDPYKNLFRLIEAFSLLKKDGFSGKLVIAGKLDARYPDARNAVVLFGVEEDVVFTDFVSSTVLDVLYKNALAVVQPSLVEGFGLTALEPVFYGKVSALSYIPSHKEIFGERAFYFNPFDARDICEVLKRVSRLSVEEKENQIRFCKALLSRFNEKEILKQWRGVIDEILGC